MTFPQPSADAAVAAGQDLFRLQTALQSPGDIFESPQSALAVALGPNSDLATMNVYYYDPVDAFYLNGAGLPVADKSKVAQFTISPDRAFIGRVDARNDTNYPLANRPGRILFAAGDIVDPTWQPATTVANDGFIYEPVVVDVIQYFQLPPTLESQRSDKVYRYLYLSEGLDPLTNNAWLILPAYGRKSGFFSFINRSAADPHDVQIIGANLSTAAVVGGVGASFNGSFEKSLFTAAALAANASTSFVFKSSTDGLFDVFAIRIGTYDQAEPFCIQVRLSDDAL